MTKFWTSLGPLLLAFSMLSGEPENIRFPLKPAQDIAESQPYQAADAHVLDAEPSTNPLQPQNLKKVKIELQEKKKKVKQDIPPISPPTSEEIKLPETKYPKNQPPVTPTSTAKVHTISAAEKKSPFYKLHIGDRLLISIYGEPNTEREVVIDSYGNISYPIVGTIKIVDKNIDQARQEMNDRIKKVYRFTYLNITPIEFAGQYYTILGQVNVPGKKTLLGKETVLTALCRAGGFPSGNYRTQTMELADLDHAFLTRGGEYVPVNFRTLVEDGDLAQDVQLEGGDYIYIPSSFDKNIYVMGEVFAPSTLGYINKITLAEAIIMAGGPTMQASSRAVVVRGSLCEPYTFYIDVNRIFKGCCADFALIPGDIVYLPPRKFDYVREIAKFAVRTFVGSAFSIFGQRAFQSVTGSPPELQNVNVIPGGGNFPIYSPIPVGGTAP